MRIIAIGDTHGHDTYRQIIEKEINNCDLIIFIGDYLDTTNPELTCAIQLYELNNILLLKEQYPDKVILLCGNHDHHYLSAAIQKQDTASGFQDFSHYNYTPIIEKAIREEKLQLAYSYKELLFTHAGVSNSWLKVNEIPNDENLVQTLNDILIYKPLVYGYMYTWDLVVKGRKMGNIDKSLKTQSFYAHEKGNAILYSPIWIRPQSLFNDLPNGYIQIVGHTSTIQPKFYKNVKKRIEMITIDCLGSKCYLEIIENDEGEFEFNTKDI